MHWQNSRRRIILSYCCFELNYTKMRGESISDIFEQAYQAPASAAKSFKVAFAFRKVTALSSAKMSAIYSSCANIYTLGITTIVSTSVLHFTAFSKNQQDWHEGTFFIAMTL
jgi:hypothetical protein